MFGRRFASVFGSVFGESLFNGELAQAISVGSLVVWCVDGEVVFEPLNLGIWRVTLKATFKGEPAEISVAFIAAKLNVLLTFVLQSAQHSGDRRQIWVDVES
jgi:hypothetical protein